MKKRDVQKPGESRPSLRRTTRAQSNRTTSPKSDISEASVEKNTSPFDRSSHSNINVSDGKKSDPLVTPKSSRSLLHTKRTPTGSDDGFYSNCSQQDPNRLVVWDCSSPDAVRYVQQKRRRRHASDVVDIVQNLIVPEEDGAEDEGKEFLLEKWLESKPLEPEHMKHKSNRVGKRKERGRRLRKDVHIPEELLKRLQQAVTGTNDETGGKEDNGAQSKLDVSKDLFESSERKDSFMASPVFGKKATAKGDSNASDVSWSEDDFFDNDSFIIKATQSPEKFFISKRVGKAGKEKESTPCKRKPSGNSVEDQPLKKIVKYSNDPPKSAIAQNPVGKPPINKKLHSFPNQRSKVQPRTSSPFRKFRSFEDDQTGRSSFRLDNAQKVKPITTTKSFSSTAAQRNVSVSANKSKGFVQGVHKIFPVTSNTGNISNSKSGSEHSKKKPISMIQKPVQSGNPKLNNVPIRNQAPASCGNHRTGQLNFPTKTCGSFYRAVNSSQAQCSNTYAQYKNASKPVPSGQAAMGNTKPEPQQQVNSNASIASAKGGNSKRRSAGMFDTSLPDDLLCQLAEPDEILESQISPNSKKVVSEHPSKSSVLNVPKKETVSAGSGSLSSANQVNTKTVNARNSFSIKSEPCDITMKPVEKSQSNVAQSANSNFSTKNTANIKKEPDANDKSSESQHFAKSSSSKGTTSQLASSGKTYSFKSKPSVASNSTNHTASEVVKTEKPVNVYNKPIITAVAPGKSVTSFPDDSEDLFASDEDNSLGEPEILALLDDVEMKATQIENSQRPLCSQDGIGRKPQDGSLSQSCVLLSEEMDHGPSNSQSSNSQSPFKCTPEEIEKKRQEAISKLKKKSSCSNIQESDNVCTSEHSSSQCSASLSPFKCTQEEIEQKRQAALSKLNHKSSSHRSDSDIAIKSPVKYSSDECQKKAQVTTPKERKGSSSSTSHSPFKCSPSEIEQKKNAALAKRRQKSCILSANESPSKNDFGSAQKLSSISPSKLMHEEIERKKQAALKLREERQKAARNLTSSLSSCTSSKR